MSKFFITTAIGYINAPPHMGHALEYVQADVLARYHRILGDRVFFLTGTDENGSKAFRTAKEQGLKPKELADLNSKKFQELDRDLEISYDFFIRTSDQKNHWPGVKSLWQRISSKGDIYKAKYEGFYCVGCEAFLTKRDLIKGKCKIHEQKPEVLEEENYFFRLSKYQNPIQQLIESDQLKIIPETRKNEMLGIIGAGLSDISFSRPKVKLPWGIPVPNDPTHIVYVWGDALTNYITAIGYNQNQKKFKEWWPANLHIVGKDILKFHAIYWPAMLLSAELPLPKAIFVHGFITAGGKKMSKSLGNIIDPFVLINQFGAEAVRYYLLKEIPATEDGDLTVAKFQDVYNGELANGLGNLVARVATLCEKSSFSFQPLKFTTFQRQFFGKSKVGKFLEKYEFSEALQFIWKKISQCDKKINQTKPWELLKNKNKKVEMKKVLQKLIDEVREITLYLEPFLPETSEKIQKQFKGPKIQKAPPLFPRI
jgi:methionyl-tRNA synthetase